jgi:hypothetical protein
MRTKILKTAIYFSGFICLYAMLATRILPLWNLVMTEKTEPEYWDGYQYGELYYFNNISYFKKPLPPAKRKYQHSEKHPTLDEAAIFTFGDSFVDFSRNTQIAERLNDSLGVPVYHQYSLDPLEYFSSHGYENDKPKILLYVRTERGIPLSFSAHGPQIHVDFTTLESDLYKKISESTDKKKVKQVIEFLFNSRTEELLKRLVKGNYLFSRINIWIATIKFDLLGYVSSYTPKYLVNDEHPWLFFHDQVNDKPTSFYYPHTDEEITRMADHIKMFSDNLWEHYRMRLLLMPVPAKYTIYHKVVTPDDEYNNLLPRLYEKLQERNVAYLELLDDYLNSEQYVFFGTDDHWTEAGASIAAQHAIKAIRELNLQQAYNNKSSSPDASINQ